MGLDNYWNIPKNNQENLDKFFEAIDDLDFYSETPSDVEFESVNYLGEHPLNLVGGIFSNNGDGSFRGKFYTPLCDALLQESDWLYYFHSSSDIIEAYEVMKPYLKAFQEDDGDSQWLDFIHTRKDYTNDPYQLFDEYTIQDAIDFIKMFEYYSQVENICLIAWY